MATLDHSAQSVAHGVTLPEGNRYCIYRVSENRMVPLVPVDQLPFRLQGLPRELNLLQLAQEKWQPVGQTKEPQSPFVLQPPGPSSPAPQVAQPVRFLAPDHNVRAEAKEATSISSRDRLATPVISRPYPNAALASPHPDFLEHADRTKVSTQANRNRGHRLTIVLSLTASIANVYGKDAQRVGYKDYARVPYASVIEPDPMKKEYCSHWIRTGECDYTAQGCRYKHEMPSIEKLHEIGFRHVPQWWRDKTPPQLRGATWTQRRMQVEKEEKVTSYEPARGNRSVSSMFRRIAGSSGPTLPEESDFEVEEVIDPAAERRNTEQNQKLIDLGTSAPPPSRRESASTASTVSDSDAECSSPASQASTPLSQSPPALVAASPVQGPVSPSAVQHKPRAPQHSDVPQLPTPGRSQAERTAFKKETVTRAPEKPKKSGLAYSKHATKAVALSKSKHPVKATSKANATTKPTQAHNRNTAVAPVDLEKQITNLAQKQHRRSKKASSLTEQRASEIDLLL